MFSLAHNPRYAVNRFLNQAWMAISATKPYKMCVMRSFELQANGICCRLLGHVTVTLSTKIVTENG